MAAVMAGLDANGDTTALHTPDGGRVSYAELSARADRLARGLLDRGLEPGQRFAFLLPNGSQIVECYLACARSGIVGVPLSERLTAAELSHQLEDSGAAALLYPVESASLVAQVAASGGCPELVISLQPNAGTLDYESLLASAAGSAPEVSPRPEDPLCVMYTGGTTGVSKAAIQTQESWAASVQAVASRWRLSRGDRHLVVLPMDHVSWFSTAAMLHVGGEVQLAWGWSPAEVLEMVERDRITVLNMIPTMLGDLVEQAAGGDARDLSSLRLLTVAGSPMPVEMYHRAHALFGQIIGCIYGMTESSGPVTFLLPEDLSVERLRSGGRPGPGIELAILDEDGYETDGSEPGEIGLRGAQMTVGYLNQREETERAFKDGWFLSGDVGVVDEHDFLYIVDRQKDMIKSGGFNVYPKEVEEVLYEHPEVVEAAVVGLPHPRWIEAVHAAVVLKRGAAIEEDGLRAFCRERLPGYKVPKEIHLEQELPRTKVNKFDKLRLKQRYAERRPSD
jgi:acyl-CoA synthetase (AMP-forming)/AMP-acid ligase II